MQFTEEDLASFMEKEKEKRRNIDGRQLLRRAREDAIAIGRQLDGVVLAPGGVAEASDAPFAAANTFLPSTMTRTMLGLAVHYVRAADGKGEIALSSFVVLRAAIECIASAHWLMSGGSRRENTERTLKRMWWDTMAAADMATTVDGNPDISKTYPLRRLITVIAQPIKGLDPESIFTSKRESLSGIVRKASAGLSPDDRNALYAAWMACAAVSHGNIAVSAGAGVAPGLIQNPSKHLIDNPVYASMASVAVADLRKTVELFESRAAEMHTHRNPNRASSGTA